MAGPIADTRNPSAASTAASSALPDWMSGLGQYAIPKTGLTPTTATSLVQDPLSANIAAAPSLDKISQILADINQRAYLSAPGRQEALGAIQNRVAGNLSTETISGAQLDAAQRYGGAGFGVDTPAWQSAISRAIALDKEKLIGEGLGELESFYKGMPVADVQKYTLTPSDYATAQAAAQNRQLQLAELQQKGALTMQDLAQKESQFARDLALKQAAQAIEEQKWDIQRKADQAALYAKYGIGTGGKTLAEQRAAEREREWARRGTPAGLRV